jgi:subtilisin family serine protease
LKRIAAAVAKRGYHASEISRITGQSGLKDPKVLRAAAGFGVDPVFVTHDDDLPGQHGDLIGAGRRLLQQGGRPGLCRPRDAHGRDDRLADQRPGHRRRRSECDARRPQGGHGRGYFFTDSVVNGLLYAGDQGLDAVNMRFFADPWLFNCRNDPEQRAIVQAISRATLYAQQRGVVLIAAAGNEGINLNHPTTDEISPDFPAGAAVPRHENNSCVVAPTELPGVVVVSATGAENLLSYSSYGNLVDVAAPGGSRFQTPTDDSARGRVLAPYSSTASDLAAEAALGRLVQDPSTGAYYAWLNGTSMAAPHATGVVALIRAAHSRDAGRRRGRCAPRIADAHGLSERTRPGGRLLRGAGAGLQRRCLQQQLLREGARQRAGGSQLSAGRAAAPNR